jgi:hypothetical protein
MSPLRVRFIQDMILAGLSSGTQQAYCTTESGLAPPTHRRIEAAWRGESISFCGVVGDRSEAAR